MLFCWKLEATLDLRIHENIKLKKSETTDRQRSIMMGMLMQHDCAKAAMLECKQ